MNWINIEDQKPNDKQECWIIHEHLFEKNKRIFGIYRESFKCFLTTDTSRNGQLPVIATHWFPACPQFKSDKIKN